MTKKDSPLCIHTYLILKAGLVTKNKVKANVTHEFDRQATVLHVTNMIKKHFPTATAEKSEYLKNNKKFIDRICKVREGFQIKLKEALWVGWYQSPPF